MPGVLATMRTFLSISSGPSIAVATAERFAGEVELDLEFQDGRSSLTEVHR
jgi:hypothetical protein